MPGFDGETYGDGFADVYDDWYGDVSDVAATVELVLSLCRGGQARPRILELGVGTGRIAVPLGAAGAAVVGLDSSRAMLDRLRSRPGGDAVTAIHGDMVDDLPSGPFDVVLAAYNTFLNLLDVERQRSCVARVADVLARDGCFVVEAAVPPEVDAGHQLGVRSVEADRVVLSVTEHDPERRTTIGQFVDLTEEHGVRLRPWAVRWTTVDELDEMAAAAGLTLVRRTADVGGADFGEGSERHVSTYRHTG